MGNSQSISEQRSHAMQNYVDFDGDMNAQVKEQPEVPAPQPKKIPDYVSLIAIAAIFGVVIYGVTMATKD